MAPMPVTNKSTTPNFAQPEVTTFQSIKPEEIEHKPQDKKNIVINHLCFPKAYSLTILKFGLNSVLMKCKAMRHRIEITPNAIVPFANKDMFFIMLFLIIMFRVHLRSL